MTNKTNWLGIIAFVCAAAFTGCPTEDEALVRKELYGVKILSVTPDLIAGAEQQVAVTVEYNLQVNLDPHIQLIVAFNTVDVDGYRVYGHIDITEKGSRTHTFNATVTSADWSAANGDFQVRAFYGFTNGYLGFVAPSAVLASDTKALPLRKEEGYWTVTWHLNGGERGESFDNIYHGRVKKGEVLAEPGAGKILSVINTNSNQFQILYFFGGWYMDPALTQPYNFANSVTGDLNLYAKFEERPSVEYLYGTWIRTQSNEPSIFTISPGTITGGSWSGDYYQLSNVVWTPAVNPDPLNRRNPNGYTYTHSGSNENSDFYTVAGNTLYVSYPRVAGYTEISYTKYVEGSEISVGWLKYERITSGKNADTYRVRRDNSLFGNFVADRLVIPAVHYSVNRPITEIGSIGDTLYSGDNGAFQRTVFASVTIPDSVNTIGSYAFYDCRRLASVTIGNGVTVIGDRAFRDCISLTGITIPDSVTAIGDEAFYRCTGLTSVTLPASVTSIGDQAFNSCTGLTEITIPDSVTSIGDRAFGGCTGLTSVTIPDSVTTIGERVFVNCTGIPSVTIPATVTTVGERAFMNWTSSQTVYVPWAEGNRPSGWNSNWDQNCNAHIVYQR